MYSCQLDSVHNYSIGYVNKTEASISGDLDLEQALDGIPDSWHQYAAQDNNKIAISDAACPFFQVHMNSYTSIE